MATLQLSRMTGGVLYQTDNYGVIATGLDKSSHNPKTGKAVQIWILATIINPVEAVKSGEDAVVCGDCSLRGDLGKNRACYVNVGQAPWNIWHKWHRGGYSHIDRTDYKSLFGDKFIRFGAYGEPVLIPFRIVEAIAKVSSASVGYTHQWRNPLFRSYSKYFMASTTIEDYQDAIALGWRTFTVSKDNLSGLMVCPASREFKAIRGYRLTCKDCGQCGGTSTKGRSVQIQPHGSGAKWL